MYIKIFTKLTKFCIRTYFTTNTQEDPTQKTLSEVLKPKCLEI